MKIGIISDLHIDSNNRRLQHDYKYVPMLSEMMADRHLDVMLIAGDISSDYQLSHDFLKELQDQSGKPAFFVPGNHEFWQPPESSTDAHDIFNYFLKQEENLVGQVRHLNEDWALVGSPGWYDYGYGNHEQFSLEDFERKKYRFAHWNDKRFVHWRQSDREVSRWMKEQLIADLESVKDKKIILMTHVATHPRFVVPLPHKLYDYVNAFLGARSYESLYRDYDVRYNIMGHVHWQQTLISRRVKHMMACLGTRKQWMNRLDPKTEIENTLMSFHIN